MSAEPLPGPDPVGTPRPRPDRVHLSPVGAPPTEPFVRPARHAASGDPTPSPPARDAPAQEAAAHPADAPRHRAPERDTRTGPPTLPIPTASTPTVSGPTVSTPTVSGPTASRPAASRPADPVTASTPLATPDAVPPPPLTTPLATPRSVPPPPATTGSPPLAAPDQVPPPPATTRRAEPAPFQDLAPGPGGVPDPAGAVSVQESVAEHAARVVRETWSGVEPRLDELTPRFATLLFTLAPDARALFPSHLAPPVRRLVRSLVVTMGAVDRPGDLEAQLPPLVAEHRALGLAADQYAPVGSALVAAARELAGPGWNDTVERAWAQAFSLAVGPLEEALRAGAVPAITSGTVVDHRRLGWDLAVLRVEPDEPVEHRAGQYVGVEIPQRPKMWRPLTPASAPRTDGRLEFHVRAVEGGWVSRSIVAHTDVDDRWRFGPAQGRLTVDPASDRDVVMVAGGTGAAPMLALCEELVRAPQRPAVTVFLGGRTRDDLYALGRFRALAARHAWLDVAGVCEEDPLSVDTAPGTLPDAVVRGGDWSAHDVLLAGSPGMVRATASALMVDGVGLDRIHYDPFS